MHNGFTNYETWAASLWIHNDYNSQKYYETRATQLLDELDDHLEARYLLASELQEDTLFLEPHMKPSLYSDLLEYAIAQINWAEVADTFIES